MSLIMSVDVSRLLAKMTDASQVVLDEAELTVMQASEIGAQAARESLDAAETEYGRYRMSIGQGNSSGRNDSGNMISKLKALEPIVEPGYVAVAFGWDDADYEDYFDYQENGTSRIPQAHSLADGEAQVNASMGRLRKNMLERIRRKI